MTSTPFNDVAESAQATSKDSGAVLLMTLLIMSVMAVFAVLMVEDILLAVKRTAHIESEAQANWFLAGADEYAETFLETSLSAGEPAAANARLLAGVNTSFPLENGLMTIDIRDGSNCLSLGLLAQPEGRDVFNALLVTLGWPERDAEGITARLADWVDEDEIPVPATGGEDFFYLGLPKPYRTANTFFETVYELRALGVMSEREFQFLRPFICAHKPAVGETTAPININTLTVAQAPLLAAALGSAEHLQLALNLIGARPNGGWDDVEAFWASPEIDEEFDQNDSFGDLLLGVEPTHIWVDVTIGYLSIEKRAAFEYRVNDGSVEKSYRYFGDESHWPRPINLLEASQEQ